MKRSLLTVAIGCAALNFVPAQATQWAPLCDWCLPEGCWEVGAAAIYEQFCALNFNYADGVNSVATPAGTQLLNHTLMDVNPKAYWGFEVWLGWYEAGGCRFIDGLYKRLHSYKHNKTANLTPFTAVNIAQIGTVDVAALAIPVVSAKQRFKYDTAYLRFGHSVLCKCGTSLYGYAAGRYVGAEINRCITLPNVVTTSDRSRFDGGGLELGLTGESPRFCGFSFVGTVGTMALFGNRSDKFSFNVLTTATTGTGGLDPDSHFYPKRRITKCVPGIDFLAGLRYTYDLQFCGCCLRLIGEVGWEMDYFWSILGDRPANTPRTAGVGLSEVSLRQALSLGETRQYAEPRNFGTSGLYLALSVRL